MTTVSTAAFFERSTQQLGALRRRAESLQTQIASGERLARSSDDPVAAARLRALDRRETLAAVDQTNSDRAAADLRLADGALAEMADLVIRARELALAARNGTLSDSDLARIGTEISQLRNGLFALANSRSASGEALFGGETTGAAYVMAGGGISYVGTDAALLVDVGDGQSVPRTLVGPDVLAFDAGAGPTDLFATLALLAAGLNAGGTSAQAAVGEALAGLDAGLERITTAQTIVGTRQAWMETLDQRRAETGELLAEERATVGGADLALTISRLQETLTVLEASQASFVRLAGLSLFNQLR